MSPIRKQMPICKRFRRRASGWWSDLKLNHLALWPRPAGVVAGPGRPLAGWRVEQSSEEPGGNSPTGSAGERGWAGENYHRPIMAAEVVHFVQPESGKFILDGTLGGAGHTELFLKAGAHVLATDRDPTALTLARQRLEPIYGDKFTALHSNFADFPTVLEAAGLTRLLDGIFLDLGLSSRQLENGARGFSLKREGKLDMRFDPDAPLSAEELVNTWSEEDLIRLLRELGEEPNARRIARAIVARRQTKAIVLTTDLAAIVASVVPQRGRTHPATRTFQAIRLEINQELKSLERALEAAPKWLAPGGRLVILTFHSLEDRIAKQFLRRHSEAEIDRPEWSSPRPNPNYHFNLVVRKAIDPSPAEIASNPRARSCKLRVAERIGTRPASTTSSTPSAL
jgi:16S rRNA (cytosine1402-N4)-methyltransferase